MSRVQAWTTPISAFMLQTTYAQKFKVGKKPSLPANSATYAAAVEQKNGFDILYFSQSISLTLLKQKESKKATRIAITFESYIFPSKWLKLVSNVFLLSDLHVYMHRY